MDLNLKANLSYFELMIATIRAILIIYYKWILLSNHCRLFRLLISKYDQDFHSFLVLQMRAVNSINQAPSNS